MQKSKLQRNLLALILANFDVEADVVISAQYTKEHSARGIYNEKKTYNINLENNFEDLPTIKILDYRDEPCKFAHTVDVTHINTEVPDKDHWRGKFVDEQAHLLLLSDKVSIGADGTQYAHIEIKQNFDRSQMKGVRGYLPLEHVTFSRECFSNL